MPILYSFLVAGSGVGVFHWFQLPLPWLLGPIFASLLAALFRIPMKGVPLLNNSMRTILGVAVGATLTPAVLSTFPAMWPTLILIPVMIACIGALGIPYFQRLCGFDFPTAYYSTMPGGLQDMIIFGEEAGGDVRTISLIHATRVMVIVVALPFILIGVWDADLSNPPGAMASTIPIHEMGLMALCAFIGWRVAKRVGLFGASILGPMIAAAALALAGGLHNRPPAEAIWAAQFFIGLSIGTKYSGITWNEVKRDLLAGLGFCLILIVLTLIFVEVIYNMGFAPGLETLLAFAPGGQAELTVLAIIVGADMAFVVAHHMIRIVVVIVGAPVASLIFDNKPKG